MAGAGFLDGFLYGFLYWFLDGFCPAPPPPVLLLSNKNGSGISKKPTNVAIRKTPQAQLTPNPISSLNSDFCTVTRYCTTSDESNRLAYNFSLSKLTTIQPRKETLKNMFSSRVCGYVFALSPYAHAPARGGSSYGYQNLSAT